MALSLRKRSRQGALFLCKWPHGLRAVRRIRRGDAKSDALACWSVCVVAMRMPDGALECDDEAGGHARVRVCVELSCTWVRAQCKQWMHAQSRGLLSLLFCGSTLSTLPKETRTASKRPQLLAGAVPCEAWNVNFRAVSAQKRMTRPRPCGG